MWKNGLKQVFSGVGILGSAIFLSPIIVFPRILIVLFWEGGRGDRSRKLLNLNAAAFLIWFHLQRDQVSFSWYCSAARDIWNKNGDPVERSWTGQAEIDDATIKSSWRWEWTGKDGQQGEAFSVYEEDSHSRCSMLYFKPARSQLL